MATVYGVHTILLRGVTLVMLTISAFCVLSEKCLVCLRFLACVFTCLFLLSPLCFIIIILHYLHVNISLSSLLLWIFTCLFLLLPLCLSLLSFIIFIKISLAFIIAIIFIVTFLTFLCLKFHAYFSHPHYHSLSSS